MSYCPYVEGGPVEAGYLSLEGLDLVVYVNPRYPDLDAPMINPRASALFEMAGVGMFGGAVTSIYPHTTSRRWRAKYGRTKAAGDHIPSG